MAGFGVHAAAGVSLSGLAATGTLLAGLASPTDMLIYLVAGSLGSLLPDLDADQSAPVQVSFTLASIALAFGVMFQFAHQFPSVAELATIWLLSYVLFRWLVFALFARITRHRGIIHSVPAGIWFGLLASAASYHLGGLAPLSAWLLGTFVTFGFLVHLLLDELFSINLFGFKTRRSLGSAFKFWSRASPGASVACCGWHPTRSPSCAWPGRRPPTSAWPAGSGPWTAGFVGCRPARPVRWPGLLRRACDRGAEGDWNRVGFETDPREESPPGLEPEPP